MLARRLKKKLSQIELTNIFLETANNLETSISVKKLDNIISSLKSRGIELSKDELKTAVFFFFNYSNFLKCLENELFSLK